MAYNFSGPTHSDQTLDHVPEFKTELDGCVFNARSVVYIGWRPHDSGYNFFDWLGGCHEDGEPPLTLVVEAWKPNFDAFNPPYRNCFKVHGQAEQLLNMVPDWMRDCVVWQDGPEHLLLKNGLYALRCWQSYGFKSIVISTPDGWLEQEALDGNEYEKHLSAWDKATYQSLDFKVKTYSAGLIGYWRKDE